MDQDMLLRELRALAGNSNPAPWTSRLATVSADEIERLRAALADIARQHLSIEMRADQRDHADYEYAYHAMVQVAREAMRDTSAMNVRSTNRK